MKMEVLVSAVEKEPAELISQMNISSDAVVVNQCGRYAYDALQTAGGSAKCFSM